MSAARAALHSLLDLALAALLAVTAAVLLWNYVGTNDPKNMLKGELAVRLGAESVGIPVMGDRADLWAFSAGGEFVAADLPATDDRLKEWLEAQPGVSNARITRRTESQWVLERFHYDTYLSLRYDRAGHLGPVIVDWRGFGYRPPRDRVGPTGGAFGEPKFSVGHARGVLWLIGVACAHGAVLVVLLLRVAVGLIRGRRTLPPEAVGTVGTAQAIVYVLIAAVVVVGLVVFHERLVTKLIPHATARGWVWFSWTDWINKEAVGQRILVAFLAGPLAVQLFVRYLLAARWRAAGRPIVAVPLSAVLLAALWLDVSLVPLGLAVGAVLGWLASRGVSAVGLIALHAIVNSVLFSFLLSGSQPPSGHDPRLVGTWVPVGTNEKTPDRLEFTANGGLNLTAEHPPDFFDGPAGRTRTVNGYYLFIDRDLVLVRGIGMGKVRIAFEGDELVVAPAEGANIDRAERFKRAP